MSGSLRPGAEVDPGALVTNRLQQFVDDVNVGLCHVPERARSRAAATLPKGEGQVGRDLAFHLHAFGVRGFAKDPQDYCAFVQYSPVDANSAVGRDCTVQSQLFVTKAETPEVHQSVLVLVPEIVQSANVRAVRPAPLWIGLQRLDKCLWAVPDAPDLVHPSGGRPPALAGSLFEGSLPNVDRKGRSVDLPSRPVDRQPVDALVETGPQVMQRLAEYDGPLDGDRAEELQAVEVLAAIVVRFFHQTPWPVLIPSGHIVMERSEVLVRSIDLDVYPVESTLVDFHDLVSEGHAGREGTDAADPAQEGRADHDSGSDTR